MKRRLLSAFLVVCMMLTMIPSVAFAADGEGEPGTTLPPETCTVEYKEQSEGITTEWIFDEDHFELTITIDETAQGDLVVDLSTAVMNMMNEYAAEYGKESYPVLPGDSNPILVKIQNNSGREYQYKEGSFVLATADASQWEQSEVMGYDGQYIPKIFVGAVSFTNTAMQKLFDKSKDDQITAAEAFEIYDRLAAEGYTGTDPETGYGPLTRYILDAYRKTSIDELNPDIFAVAGQNGIFTMSQEALDQYTAEHPE